MTNKERTISLIGYTPTNDNAVEAAIIDAGLVSTDVYVIANSSATKVAAIELMNLLLTMPDTKDGNASQGFVFEKKFDREAILKRIDQLQQELGTAAGPTITAKNMW